MADVDLQQVYSEMSPEQKDVARWLVGAAVHEVDDIPDDIAAAHDAMTPEQKTLIDHMVKSTITYRPSEDDSNGRD